MSELKRADGKWILAFLGPYAVVFTIFIIVPIIMAVLLSFTNFNTIQFPDFVGLKNYISLFTYADVFMQYVLPNTVKFALIV